jgi:hypothetical protein
MAEAMIKVILDKKLIPPNKSSAAAPARNEARSCVTVMG